jgi:hypothetical protein
MSYPADYDAIRALVSRNLPSVAPVMVAALRDRGLSQIDVRFKGVHINTTTFAKVRHLVESGQVLVRYSTDPTFQRRADTKHEYDLMVTGVNNTHDLYDRSVFIHEAIHIRSDMRGRAKPQMPDEVLAFVIQAVFLRFGGLQANNYPGATNQTLLPAALPIADALLTKTPVTRQQEAALEAAIKAMPIYRNIDNVVLRLNAVRPLRH